MKNEKLDRYIIRTMEHIHRVHKNMVSVVTKHRQTLRLTNEDCRKLMENVLNHDRSKFSNAQFEPYIELTEYYRQRKVLGNTEYDYPTQEIKEKVKFAIHHHYMSENHHPERLVIEENLIDDEQMNAAFAFEMTPYEIIEVCCDLQAMAQEFNEGSCRKYWSNVWWPEHSVTFGDDADKVRDLMHTVITCFEREIHEQA